MSIPGDEVVRQPRIWGPLDLPPPRLRTRPTKPRRHKAWVVAVLPLAASVVNDSPEVFLRPGPGDEGC